MPEGFGLLANRHALPLIVQKARLCMLPHSNISQCHLDAIVNDKDCLIVSNFSQARIEKLKAFSLRLVLVVFVCPKAPCSD